jgi:hypothetical protein
LNRNAVAGVRQQIGKAIGPDGSKQGGVPGALAIENKLFRFLRSKDLPNQRIGICRKTRFLGDQALSLSEQACRYGERRE